MEEKQDQAQKASRPQRSEVSGVAERQALARVNRRRMMLEDPGASTAEIARRTGFSDRSNFSRAFLSYTGLTPAKWREKARTSHDVPAPENDYV